MQNVDLSQIKKVFFIGIGGIGISALAKMVKSRDIEAFGLNDEEAGKTLETLHEEGIEVILQKDFVELPEADMYVYSDAWIYRGPKILESARDTGKPVLSYFEALGQFAKNYKVIAISGTHGKTTTTAMVAEVLIDLGLDPTVVVGSFVKKFNSNFRKGDSDILVVEADEFNKHFLNFDPIVTIITNIELDHVDTYKDLNEVENTFKELIMKTKNAVICNVNNSNLELLTQDFSGEVINYMNYFEELPKMLVPGDHNRMNASTVLALASYLNLNQEEVKLSLSKFAGTWRRLERRGETKNGVIIYDDYAHHPTEVVASLNGLRELYPVGVNKIIVVFQPHLYSRTKAFFNEFIDAFDQADEIFLLPIYFAREDPDDTVSSEKLAESIKSRGKKVFTGSFQEVTAHLQGMPLEKGTIFVTMGAGESYKIADDLFEFE